MRFATKRCSSGWTVRSSVATMYQLGLDRQATPSTLCWNRSGTGAAWVAHTSFRSASGRSPAKLSIPSGCFSQMRPSATSMWEKTSLTGNFCCNPCEVLVAWGCEGRDVDQGGASAIRPGMGDQGAAIRVADKDHGSTDPPEAASDALYVAFERVQAMLGAHHFVPVRLQCGDQL